MIRQEEITRFYMSNKELKDSAGNVDRSSLKDWNTQVQQMTRALESATNGIVKVIKKIDEQGNALATFDVKRSQTGNAQPAFDRVLGNIETRYGYKAGSLGIDPYANGIKETEDFRRITFYKSFHGALAQKTAKEAVSAAGGIAVSDPSRKLKDRMRVEFPVSDSEWNQEVQKFGGDDSKAALSFTQKFISGNLGQAERYSKSVKEEKEEKANKVKILHWFAVVVGVLTSIADITRRILTASLSRASEIKREQVEAKSLGISYSNAREYKAQETAMGMKEGTFTSAIASLQSSFGDITHLDENALGELAKVLRGDVVEAINNGLGRSNPEQLMKTILNTYYERGQSGVNSIGQQVGRYQAERELATALEKAGLNDLAEILRNMFYTNDSGIYKGRISTEDSFADYMGLVTAYTMGFDSVDNKHFSELGAVVDSVKSKLELLKESLEKLVLVSLSGLIQKIDNWDIGKSAEEKLEDYRNNIQLNADARDRLQNSANIARSQYTNLFQAAGINVSDFGIEGVSTVEDFLAFINTRKGIQWSPQGGQATEAYAKFVQFLNTDKGMEAIRLVHYTQVAEKKAQQADEAYKEGLRTGKVPFNKADYTAAAIATEMGKGLTTNGREFSSVNLATASNEFSAVNLLYRSARGASAVDALYTDRDIWEEYKRTYLLGGEMTYETALASGEAGKLTDALYNQITPALEAKGALKGKTKEEAIRYALANGLINNSDVEKLVSKNAGNYGWGISSNVRSKVRDALVERGLSTFSEQAEVNNVLSEALGLQQARDFLNAHNAEGVTATVGGYNEREGRVEVVLSVKGGDGSSPKEVLSFYTDSVLGENKTYTADLDDVVNSAQNRRATR